MPNLAFNLIVLATVTRAKAGKITAEASLSLNAVSDLLLKYPQMLIKIKVAKLQRVEREGSY